MPKSSAMSGIEFVGVLVAVAAVGQQFGRVAVAQRRRQVRRARGLFARRRACGHARFARASVFRHGRCPFRLSENKNARGAHLASVPAV